MMSTQNQAEHGVIHSSIALLQERFRQLQRVKEMREKKQLLRLFSDNYKINIPSDSFHHEPSSASPITTTTTTTTANKNDVDDDVVMVDDDELHIFLPPNYYSTNYSRSSSSNNNSKPTSCYSSSLLSHNNNNNNNQDYPNINNINNNNLTEISLSLWPPAPAISYNNGGGGGGGGGLQPSVSRLGNRLPSSCVSTASKFEDSQLVSDVDTTLHL